MIDAASLACEGIWVGVKPFVVHSMGQDLKSQDEQTFSSFWESFVCQSHLISLLQSHTWDLCFSILL